MIIESLSHPTFAPSSSGTSAWLTSAAVVAICALVFTIASFWWLNARRGHLKTFEPHTFAIAITPQMVRLRLPLVLYNTGAIPIIIQNLRVSFQDRQNSVPLPWVATRSQIKPDTNDGHAFPAVFSVAGRTAYQIFAEFGAPTLGFVLEARDYPVSVDAKLGHKEKWQSLLTFSLQAGQIVNPGSFITYGNVPGSLSEDQRKKAETALNQLAQQLAVRDSGS